MSNEPTHAPESSPPDDKAARLLLPLSSLYLDPNNFRFIDDSDYEEIKGDAQFNDDVQRRTQRFILGAKAENVTQLISSFKENGWLDVGPIHVRRASSDRYIVVEGNRRVSTLKFMKSQYENATGQLGKLSPSIFEAIPCVLYEEQDAVHHKIIMGLHHISGKRAWPPINQAKLMRSLRDEHKQTPEKICAMLGVTRRDFNLSVRTLALCEAYQRSDYGDQFHSEQFNVLREVLKAPDIRKWLDWDEWGERAKNREHQSELFSWISHELAPDEENEDEANSAGDKRYIEPAITTGGQIRDLAKFILDPVAVRRLNESRSLAEASMVSDLLVTQAGNDAVSTLRYGVERLARLSKSLNARQSDDVQAQILALQSLLAQKRGGEAPKSPMAPWNSYTEVSRTHLTAVHVAQYRGLKNLVLKQPGRINLIVGDNNAGKTSFLEAVSLLIHQSDPRGLFESLRRRARWDVLTDMEWLKPELPCPAMISGQFGDPPQDEVSVHLSLTDDPDDPETNRAGFLGVLEIEAKFGNKNQRSTSDLVMGTAPRTTLIGEQRWICPTLFHSPFSASDPTTLQRANEQAVKLGIKDRVLQFLRDFLDVDLKSVELVRDHRFAVTHARRVPSPDLSSFGDGLQRAFQIGLLFGGAEGGVLLIDELENALHTSLLIDFTKLIQQLAVEFNVQVFITTHSKETVDAFLFNEYRIEDVVAFRLERDGETTLARRHQGSSLIQAVRAVDLDIRWSK